ncbi:NAD(P)H-dependent oxidoreductase [Martelella sp. HB161492]|uniref:NADPH-dependent FMN reductase n=1 Tax=Martelella sp. HB161492 TaxID=2720726 RepID=UPI001AEEC6E5|nr:NAD(P)H-dependent oxidoreductase [Martelella sp. HB161492]
MKLNIIIGSTRPGRVGPTIGKWFEKFARENSDFEVELVDLAAFKLPLLDEANHPVMQQYEHEHTKKWSASVASADAYVFLTPEYDSFPPASLLNALQALVKEWAYKPAGIMSYAFVSAGLRAAMPLRLQLNALNIHAIPQGVPIPFFPQFINDQGEFTPNELTEQGAKAMLDELAKWAPALAAMREDEKKASQAA